MARKPIWPPRIHKHQSGQARVHWRGKDHYLGLHGSPEADRAYAELLLTLTQEEPPAPQAVAIVTVADVVAQFLANLKEERPQRLKDYRAALTPVVRVCGQLPAEQFDDLALERVRLSMIDGSWMTEEEKAKRLRMKSRTDWCRLVINRHIGRVGTCWRWAERRKLVPRGAWANLRTLPPLRKGERGVRETPKRRGTRRADLDTVLPFVQRRKKHRPCRAMLELQYLTGMRTGEVVLMRPCDIDRTEGPAIDGVRVWLYRPERHKTQHLDQERVVALGPEAQRLLAPWLLGCAPTEYLFRPKCTTAKHAHYSVATYDQIVWKACKLAGVHLVPYGGRHAAKDRAARALGLDTARAVLGQTSLDVTNSYGEQLDLEAAARAAAKLG